MADKRAGGPPHEDPPTATLQEAPSGSRENRSSPAQTRKVPEPGREQKHPFWCGVCSHLSDATEKRDRLTNELRWQVGNAYTPRCPRGGACLRAIAAELGTTAPALKDDPLTHLAPWLTPAGRNGSATRPLEALPSEDEVAGWHERLMDDRRLGHVRNHVWRVRRLTPDTLRRYQVGYGSYHERPAALMQPVRDERSGLAQLIESYWPAGTGRKARVLAIPRSSCLYPVQALRPDRGPLGLLIVSEGRWKALALNQCGFRAVTSITGTNWDPSWNRHVTGRCVAVLYDVDAEHIARRRADEFRAAGIDAWPVLLSAAGFSGKDGVDDALRQGWTAGQIQRHIDHCRRWYRQAVA